MSLYGALFSGVSGISAQSQSMGIIADNITNVNTIGYKTTRAKFNTLVTNSGSATKYSPGGVSSTPTGLVDRQGLLQASTSPTDLSITGKGFFVVNTDQIPTSTTGTYLYTRAGSFAADSNGYLKNTGGYYIQGYPYDANGNLPSNRSLGSLESVNISNLTGTASPTTSLSISANLNSDTTPKAYTFGNMSAGTSTPDFERSIQVFDSKGGVRALTFGYIRNNALAANQWSVEIYANPSTDVTNPNGLLNVVGASTLAFNNDGTLNTAATTAPASLSITTWAAALGIANATVSIDYGSNGQADGMTQFSTPSSLISSETNGAVYGALTGVSVSEEGIVTALFDNGTRQDIFKVPLALFPNVNGLEGRTGNAYIGSLAAGDLTLQEARTGGAGIVSASTLEASTVDLAEEFSIMIQTQQAYSASARIITSADEMLDELIRLAR
ncbi:MAG: flagellar hook protein FlgE [Rhodospirillaceae bacterium]|jgi:flagellar hook protein FlgE|nr:flagellar hook protein FlgE [Rhodospirillaceae bacterium]MBT4487083.1 flagellar hook protein FlgE [Rhodospirillaceae bacterium]